VPSFLEESPNSCLSPFVKLEGSSYPQGRAEWKRRRELLDPMTTAAQLYAGVDVSKDRLDVCLRWSQPKRHDGDAFFITYDDAGIGTLVSRLLEEHPVMAILEATGGFERAVVGALAAAGLPVAVVNPRQVRDFARATGRLAKNRSDRCRDPGALLRGHTAQSQASSGWRDPRFAGNSR
jgi:hypothetical protein